jgi:hypothetical protein
VKFKIISLVYSYQTFRIKKFLQNPPKNFENIGENARELETIPTFLQAGARAMQLLTGSTTLVQQDSFTNIF